MDIVYINQTFGFGGAEVFNLSLIKYLSQSHKVTVYSNSPYFSGDKVPFTVDLIGDWKGFLKGILYLPFLLTFYIYIILKNYTCSIYYFTGFIEKILCTPILRLLGKKSVWIEFGPLESVVTRFFHIPEYLYRLSAYFPDKVIFSAHNSLNLNKKYYPQNIPLQVLPLGSPTPPKNIAKIQPFEAICISRLEPGKGQDLLIKAWKDSFGKLIILGTGDENYMKKLKNLINNKNIDLLGYIDDKYAYLKACKFTVFPSTWPLEGFGLVITESFSMDKPVIAFDHPPGNEIIKSDYNGLLGPDLSANILKLIKQPKLLKSLSQNAKTSWRLNFQEEICLSRFANSIVK